MTLTQVTTGGVDENINIDNNTLKVDGTNNRVGIGTTSPGKDLEVYNTTGPTISLNDGGQYKSYFTLLGNDLEVRGSSGNIEFYTGSADGASSTERFRIDSSGNAQVSTGQFTVGTTASTGLQFINDGTFGTINNADLVFRTNATERMRLDTSGNLILKTTASAGEFVFREGGTNAWSIDTNGANGYLRFFDKYNNSERLRISNSRKVLINTTSPSGYADRQLTVGDTSLSSSNIEIRSATNGWGGLVFSDSTAADVNSYRGSVEYSHATNHMQFRTDAVERMRITSSGNIGINNSSPQYQLHARSNSSSSSQRIDLHMTNNTTGHGSGDGVQFGYQNVYGAYIWNFENTPIYYGTNNTERMRITGSGQLLVGATSAGSADKVLVSGQLNAGGQRFASLAKSCSVNSSVTFNISGSSEGYVFVRIRIKVGYGGNANYQMHAQYDYATVNYGTQGTVATQTGILQVEAANAQFNYSDITVSLPSDRTVRVTYAPSSGSGTHSCKVMVDGTFDSIS